MRSEPSTQAAEPSSATAPIAGTLAMLVGGLVLAGWAVDSPALKSLVPGWVAVKPNSAVAFILIGIALLFAPRSPALPARAPALVARLARLCALLAGAIGLVTLTEYALDWNPGLDQILFLEPPGAIGTSHPGRMAPDSALCFVLTAAATQLGSGPRRSRWKLAIAAILGSIVATTALASALAYTTPALRTQGWWGLTMMPGPTAATLVVLGVAIALVSFRNIGDPVLTRFSTYLWRMVGCLGALAITFALYARSEGEIRRTNERRHQSFLLADELRQSGDDLTRMARTYVVTGDPVYKQHFRDILDIRDGTKPRPADYWQPYWDLVTGGDSVSPSGQAAPLLDLMRQAGFTAAEFQDLARAKANSDGLTIPEFEAMRLVESTGPEAEADRARARRMMYDAKYHQAKVAVMGPIRDFYREMDARTRADIRAAEGSATAFRYMFAAAVALLIFTLWRSYGILSDTLGGTLDEVAAGIAGIGRGDLASPIRVRPGLSNSVMGWLARTQTRLTERETERRLAEERIGNSEAFLNRVLEQSPSSMWVADARGTMVRLNPACCALLRVKPEEVVGRYNLFDDNVVAERGFTPLVRGVFERGETARFELVYDSARLTGLPLEQRVDLVLDVTIFPIRDAQNQITHAVVQHLDITERRRAEAALLETERDRNELLDRLNAAQRFGRIGSWDLNLGTSEVWWSDETFRIFDVTPGEYVPGVEANARFVHPEDRAAYAEAFEAALRTRGGLQTTVRLVTDHGVVKDCEVRAAVVVDESGQPTHFVGTIMDVSAARLAEAEFRTLIQTSLDGFWVNDLAGRIVDVNESLCRMLGYSREELMSLTIPDIDASEKPEETAGHIRRIVETGRDRFETRHRRKDGEIREVEISAQYPPGEHRRMFAFFRDITERKRADETLRASEARYRTLVESIPEMIFMKDRDSRFVSISQNFARDLGITPDQAVGKVDSDLFPPELAEKYRADDRRIIETGATEEIEERYSRGGRETWVNTIKTPVRERDGSIIGVLGIFRDVTDRKEAEEQIRRLNVDLEQRVKDRTTDLEAANKELEAFSYSVSHDLRAPLRAIDGYGRILIEDHGDRLGPEGRRVLEVISSETRRMGRLVDDLLSFSRLGRQTLETSLVEMGTLARAVFEELSAQTPGRDVRLEAKALPPAWCDRAMIRVALVNLLGNAIKFSRDREPAVIEIACRRTDDQNVYSVKDNGVGFDMKYAHKLFGVFQRLHSTAEFEGTGVGLALVQRIIVRHGGRVWAEATVGRGATFYFSLPHGAHRS